MKFYIIAALLFLPACSSQQRRIDNITRSTVMITNLAENSGGTGTIIASEDRLSAILTNSHVCEVVKKGGIVHSYLGKHFVVSYTQARGHDLCIISVKDNLKVHTNIADKNSKPYSEVVVSGHPHLMPTIITTGWSSTDIVVKIMTKLRPCTPDQASSPDTGLFCMILGGIPVIKTYEATPVSALIQPGSSGSAVYNSKGEVQAVIFAGSGDLGYGLAVPYNYLIDFISHFDTNDTKAPDLESSPTDDPAESKVAWSAKIKEACSKASTEVQKKLCAELQETLRYSLLSVK